MAAKGCNTNLVHFLPPYHVFISNVHVCSFTCTDVLIYEGLILDQNDNNIVKTLPYGLDSFSETRDRSILNSTMEFVISSSRFEEQLYYHMNE